MSNASNVPKIMKVALLTTDNREHDKDYAAVAPRFGTAPAALISGFAGLPEVEVHVVCCSQQPLAAPEKIGPNIFYHNVVVPKLGWMRTFYQGCIRATRKKLQAIRPDIVHGQGTERDCAMSAVFSGFPNVLTIHGNMQAIAEIYRRPVGSYHWLAGRLETFVLKRTSGVFCNSGYTEGLVAARAKKTWRVPNALRPEFFAPEPARAKNARPILLNIGVVEPRKQQLEILRRARRWQERGLRFELQFLGERALDQAYGAEVARELAAAEKAGYARHLGFLSTAQVIAAMDAADGLIHFPTEEAFGLVVAEALARNLKLFGATTGGVVDIATGMDGAELFSATDFTALENAIAGWMEAGFARPQAAAQVMRERYHPLVVVRRHLEIYREVTGRS